MGPPKSHEASSGSGKLAGNEAAELALTPENHIQLETCNLIKDVHNKYNLD
jgi:hypothetical protein